MIILIQALLVWSILHLVNNSVYLYNTEDSSSLEIYDCIFHKSLYYCRHPSGPISLQRNNALWQCHHNGIRHTFAYLKSKNISANTVLQKWSSATEMVEKYARYIGRSVDSNRDHEQYICECQHPQSFGKNCEYFLPRGTTFAETLDWEAKMKSENQWKVQKYGDILCYTTLPCDSGLLCLDWRDICDDTQQCMSGYDEENCDKLEFNECEDDEYRCMNGMCIPDEYFLDGEYDCMDLTDEKGIFDDTVCFFQPASSDCDDRACLRYEWSCGDGQCIPDRLAFQKEKPMTTQCQNRRDQYYMCETHYNDPLWTLPNGRCLRLDDNNELDALSRSTIDKCEYFMKCALSEGLDKDCPCKENLSCIINEVKDWCPFSAIQYPNGGILAPYIFHFYNATRDWDISTPDFILINSTIKCRGYMSAQFQMIPYPLEFSARTIEDYLCNYAPNDLTLENTGYDRFCCNDSRTFNNLSYHFIDVCSVSRECISAYRIKDGYANCVDGQDENRYDVVLNTCSKLKRHRFRCSIQEPYCLSINKLGDLWIDCKNQYDESWVGTNTMLSKMKCNRESKGDCSFIRQYVEASWGVDDDSVIFLNSTKKIPLRAYCDTFWDFSSKTDENTSMCLTWSVCLDEQWRCRTGQCVNPEWVLDGEWDCSDASDEEGIFFSNNSLIPHNLKLLKRADLEKKFKNRYSQRPFWTICNSKTEFPCFRINMSLPLNNIQHDRPCISLDQIGDGHIDCVGALDERNTVEHCNRPTMLGKNFKCLTNNTCITHSLLCEDRCPTQYDDGVLCHGQEILSDCSEPTTDFRCLNGQCAKNGWCNDVSDCLHGEDEYLCEETDFVRPESLNVIYRGDKELNVRYDSRTFRLPRFPTEPNKSNLVNRAPLTLWNEPTSTDFLDTTDSSVAYICNRGVGALTPNGSVACFCPQQYYGDRCQFHNDRVIIKLHINFSHSIYEESSNSELVLKFLVLFLFEDQTLTSFEFHGRPALELTTYSKKIDHVIYSRSNISLRNKNERYFNRSKIVNEHPYSIRIEAYEIKKEERAQLVAVWQYPAYFDFLPSFRFAKVLRFVKHTAVVNPCSSSPCGRHKECHQVLNQNSSYVCLCPSNFTGSDCLNMDENCSDGFCTINALCKPTYRGLVSGNELPYCICPISRFGLRCELIHDQCNSNPCQNKGTCYPTAMPGRYYCVCTSRYRGNECQLEKEAVKLYIRKSVEHRGAVVQYFNIDFFTLDLSLVQQHAYENCPDFLNYLHSGQTAPEIVILKLYNNNQARIYLISVQMYVQSVNGTTEASEQNRCVHVGTLFDTNEEISVFKYHRLCIRNQSLLCFYDDNYLCICDENHTRAECFGYNHHLDRCSNCRAGGYCLRGDKSGADDYICICPQCYSGHSCQFNSQAFSFTLDQLFSTDLLSTMDEIQKQAALKDPRRFQLLCQVLHENKELLIGPVFTLVPQIFSMPLFLASTMLVCQNIESSQLRYLLITSYFVSFVPQLISFFLYISPSSFYSRQWRSTSMGKYVAALTKSHRHVPSTTDAAFSIMRRKSK